MQALVTPDLEHTKDYDYGQGTATKKATIVINVHGVTALSAANSNNAQNRVTAADAATTPQLIVGADSNGIGHLNINATFSDPSPDLTKYLWRIDGGGASPSHGDFSTGITATLSNINTTYVIHAGYDPVGDGTLTNTVLQDSEITRSVTVNMISLNLVGRFRFGSFHKASVIPIPKTDPNDPNDPQFQEKLLSQFANEQAAFRQKYNANLTKVTHLLIPDDCLIDSNENKNFTLIRLNVGPLPGFAPTDLNDSSFTQVQPNMYSGIFWDAYRAVINVIRANYGLPAITAQSMYQSLVSAYNIPVAEAAAGIWWPTPAYTSAGPQSPIVVNDPLGKRVLAIDPIVILIKQPVSITKPIVSVNRFEQYEAEIVLDDDYFHHLGTAGKGLTQQDRFDAYDADHNGEKLIVDARFRLMSSEENNATVVQINPGQDEIYNVHVSA